MFRGRRKTTKTKRGRESPCIVALQCLKQCLIRVCRMRLAELASSLLGRMLYNCLLQPFNDLSKAGYGQFLLVAMAFLGLFLKLAQAGGTILAILGITAMLCTTSSVWRAFRHGRRKHD